MDVRAHMLLQVDPGWSEEAARYVSGIPRVVEAVLTSGAYDVIAIVQTESDEALRSTLALARRTPGLCMLRLCAQPAGATSSRSRDLVAPGSTRVALREG